METIDSADSFLNPIRLERGPWQSIETLVERLFRHLGFTEVWLVGGSGDRGADIVAMDADNKRYVIQCKFTSTASGIGDKACNEVLNAYWAYEADIMIVMANTYFTPKAIAWCEKQTQIGLDARLWTGADIVEWSLEPLSADRRDLREYQSLAVAEIMRAIEEERDSALVTLATGLGETVVAATAISDYISNKPWAKVLVLAHQTPLVRQLERDFWPQITSDVETHVWADGQKPAYLNGIVFATWHAIGRAMTDGLIEAGMFQFVFVDECHHAPSPSLSQLLRDLEPEFLLGVTATPWRGDGVSLRDLFGDPVYSKTVVEGMQEGWLANVDYTMLTDSINWEEVAELSRQGLSIKDLNTQLYLPERDEAMVSTICDQLDQLSSPRALVFCRSIEHAKRIEYFFQTFGHRAKCLYGALERTDKWKILSQFRDGSLQILVSVEMLNEGIDVPDVNLICFARVTHSRRIFLQQLGRGLRLSPNKNEVIVLDFVADVRRIAAGLEINNEAKNLGIKEELKFPGGEIIRFDGMSANFFEEYLGDMADISDLDDDATLAFPPV